MTLQLSDSQRDTLRALADTLVPALDGAGDPTGFLGRGGRDLGVPTGVAGVLAELPAGQQVGLGQLLDALHAQGFPTASPAAREAAVRELIAGGGDAAAGMRALVGLTMAVTYGAPDPRTGTNAAWQAFGYPGPAQVEPGGVGPLATYTPQPGTVLDADVCVVGSGAGGGVIAGGLAQAGLRVVVLEWGDNLWEQDFTGLEFVAYPSMFWRGGPTPSADGNIRILTAQTLGGGPTVNWSNCLRTPDWVREQWASEYGLEGVNTPEFDRHLDAVMQRMGVNDHCSDLNGPHQRMREAAAKQGWSFVPALARNADPAAYSPDTAGHIGFGDRSGAKVDVRRTFLRDAVDAGARVIVRCHADRVLVENGRAAGVTGTVTDATGAAFEVTVRAPRVVVAGGSLESPALLLRSGIGGPAAGKYLHLHPVPAFLALYPEPQNPWWGGPMTAMVDEFANIEDGYGFLLQCLHWAPVVLSNTIARSSWAQHKATMARLDHAATFIGLVRDRGHGSVTIDADGNSVITYELTDEVDVRSARTAIEVQIRTHAEAGADEIVPLSTLPTRWRRGEDLAAFIAEVQSSPLTAAAGITLLTAHQMSSCRMGIDPATSVANPWGELHDTPGVYIGDASAMPTASGVNPMISAMGLAHRTAEAIATNARATSMANQL